MKKQLSIPCDRKYFNLLSTGKINFAITLGNPIYKVGFNFTILETVKGVKTGKAITSATITNILDASKYSLQPNTIILTLKIKF